MLPRDDREDVVATWQLDQRATFASPAFYVTITDGVSDHTKAWVRDHRG